MKARILLIEDDASTGPSLQKVLRAEGYDVDLIPRGDTGLTQAGSKDYDLVLTDFKLPGLSGLELVAKLHAAKPKLPIVLMTAHGTTETAIEATKLGACEYLTKPFEVDELLDVVGAAVKSSRLMSESVEVGPAQTKGFAIVGNSRAMQAVYKEIGRVAATPVTVFVRGATGTGKELVARAIYQHSDRAGKPFIAVNCTAIPQPLLESELFGHERGAFTGAQARRIRRFEQANGGTLFLDEIGDLHPDTQAKLLRVLQERCIQRVGGDEVIPVDVRVIAATHRDLEAAIQEKEFREDLYYRLSVATIQMPALSDRAEDVPELVKYFIQRYAVELGVENPFRAARGDRVPPIATVAGQCARIGKRRASVVAHRATVRRESRSCAAGDRQDETANYERDAESRRLHRGPAEPRAERRSGERVLENDFRSGAGVVLAGDPPCRRQPGEGRALARCHASEDAREAGAAPDCTACAMVRINPARDSDRLDDDNHAGNLRS
ncbi:MAG: sigma-54-dependent Fis family transcriptional regulator [Verrucomicrobia bacterium]|nr:sigma-54-dependent Fis family transcriptional regulator [Verrucomicrobiota bacterium]